MFGDKTNTDVDWLKNYATIPTNKGGFNPNCLTGQPPQLQKALKIMKLQKYETAKMVSNVSLFESLDMYFPNSTVQYKGFHHRQYIHHEDTGIVVLFDIID